MFISLCFICIGLVALLLTLATKNVDKISPLCRYGPGVCLITAISIKETGYKSPANQSRSQSFAPLDQRSENESSGGIHFEITKANIRILVIQLTA